MAISPKTAPTAMPSSAPFSVTTASRMLSAYAGADPMITLSHCKHAAEHTQC
jgi:hypothetical protein